MLASVPSPGPGVALFPTLSAPSQVWWGETDTFSSGVGGQLFYMHGSSAIRDLGPGTSVSGQLGSSWNVRILPGRTQYFTLRIAGVVVARIVYRNVQSYAANF